jgi:signal transduction histidine kinase/CheY-like chemotaxis protein/HPt (histidine-containing phosphotransfer) domain-containing protein
MKFKNVVLENYKQLLFVCAAFLAMALTSYFYVSTVMKTQVDFHGRSEIRARQAAMRVLFRAHENALQHAAIAVSMALDRDAGPDELRDILAAWTDAFHGQRGLKDIFLSILGYLDGNYLDGNTWIPGESYSPENVPWLNGMLEQSGSFGSKPYVNPQTGEAVSAISRPIVDKEGRNRGTLALEYLLDPIIKQIEAHTVSEIGYSILLDDSFSVLSCPRKEDIGKHLSELPGYAGVYERLQDGGGGVLVQPVEDSVRNIGFFGRLENGWYLGIIAPVQYYYSEVFRIMPVIGVLAFALALTLCVILVRLSAEKIRSEEESRSKSSFLARVSHEIRTPLNAILGLSEIQLQKPLPESTRADLEKIHNSGSNLLAIINDILDISKAEAGNFEIVPVDYDLVSLIHNVVQSNLVRVGSKNIAFRLEVEETAPAKLHGDELRLKQILNNLLSNAFKYTEQGKIVLMVGWEPRHGDGILGFTVNDTGIGIRQEDMDRLFTEYVQLDSRANRNVEGTGLGLAITKKLVNLMGGTIRASSQYRVGSFFRVEIPQKPTGDPAIIGAETAFNLKNLRFMEDRVGRNRNFVRSYMPYGKVLVVDDVETNLDVAKGLMLPYGLEVDCVLSGREAVEKIREAGNAPAGERYDAVFMDHMMPDIDGIEATRIIRCDIGTEYARTVPIIALTANAIAGCEEMFLAAGFDEFISKPIDIARLDATLNKWVRNKQSQETLDRAELERHPHPVSEEKGESTALFGQGMEGVDLTEGIRRYGGEAIYMQVLRSYVFHTPALLERMRALSPGTLRDYAVVVHGLKGASSGICANAVAKLSEELEKAAKSGNFEMVQWKNGALIEMVESLLADLEKLLSCAEEFLTKASPVRERRASPDEALLEKMRAAAKFFKISEMEEILADLERCEYESGGEIVRWIREQTDNLEYEAIADRLERYESDPARG